MQALGKTLVLLLEVLVQLLVDLTQVIVPWLPLIAWVAFWLLAVNWVRLRQVLLQGGAIGVALIALMTVLIWGLIAPPPDGYHYLMGLTVSNYYGKLIYVTTLVCIMLLCGSVQLSGLVAPWTNFAAFEAVADDHHGGHGHDDHGGHGHGGHGHDDHGHAGHGHAGHAPGAHNHNGH
ncbi:MAG: hypothetical protein IT428_16035 [Planctomycetaceae bacterium]|nr:hypothetical protein [Planctomycetaceae bacterium]